MTTPHTPQGWLDRFNEFSTGKTWESDGMVVLATPEQLKQFIATEIRLAEDKIKEQEWQKCDICNKVMPKLHGHQIG